ncbi:Uncharacterized transcriptional regulatory protein YxjL [Geodia barretti]|uniref:Uncharacterized transcriptional regulatory protein YxjL n=1 Tax=Geodia barretti TaxID=519541 RepID=A0AA35WQS0_GEOBA|nr:Uncharacterized transcriptional regulatory protein YxjL [Geodia barretti]
MRDGLREVLQRAGDFDVVGQAGDGAPAVRIAQQLRPDVVIMDVMMPLKNGIDACREITEMLPDTRVLILTAAAEEDAVMEAVAAGATGYLQKYSAKDKLLGTVRDVAEGEYRIPGDVIRSVFAGIRAAAEQNRNRSRARKAHTARARDTHAVRAGAILRRDRPGQEQPAFDYQERHLRNTGQARYRDQAGAGCLGSPHGTAGRLPAGSLMIS